MSLKKEIITLLEEMADLMEFDGQNPFKINAFRNGANIIRRIEGDIEEKINDDLIRNVKGIGKGLQGVIYEYNESGTAKEYEELLKKVPDGILDVLNIRGLGAKKVRLLHDSLGITNIESLKEACVNDELLSIKGFSKKTQDKILGELNRLESQKGSILLHQALKIAQETCENLNKFASVQDFELTGEVRRGMGIITKVGIIALIKDEAKFLSELSNLYKYNKLSSATSLSNLKIMDVVNTDLLIYYSTDKSRFAAQLFETTGSPEFIEKICSKKDVIKGASEKEIFENFGYPAIIPEMREKEYFDAPEKLRANSNITFKDAKGLLHFHTTFSDGLNTLKEMCSEAEELGFEYAAVCDHSKSAFYANGLTEERILLQQKEIDELNSKNKFRIFSGIESDILVDGSLDYPENFMTKFDFVVASIHSRFNLSEEDMTKRVIKAVENQYTDVLAHPTGRLLLARDPYKINMKKVIDACSVNDVAIEINANPHRLDLDWRLIYYAREKGCKFAINPDAHSTEGIMDTEYGVKIGRKGGLQMKEVINYYSKTDFIKFLKRKTSRKIK